MTQIETSNHPCMGDVAYHAYIPGFLDTDFEGKQLRGRGDLWGVAQNIDHLVQLGVDELYLSPFDASGGVDGGYDVRDYRNVEPDYGGNAALEEVIRRATAAGIGVRADMVINHTSEQHAWFQAARSSRDNPFRNFYYWADPAPGGGPPNKDPALGGGPPNNWKGHFSDTSAWHFDPHTKQYYLATFFPQMPDFNWGNAQARQAMLGDISYKLEQGLHLRVDAVPWISKAPGLPDDILPNSRWQPWDDPYNALIHEHSMNGPHLYDYLDEIVQLARKHNATIINEAHPVVRFDPGPYYEYYKHLDPKVSANFYFEPLYIQKWDAKAYKQCLDEYYAGMQPGWLPVIVAGNHDFKRVATRVGPENARAEAVLRLTLRGLIYIYQGEELGMQDVPISPDRAQDGWGKAVEGMGRDGSRTGMPWNGHEPNGGFSPVPDAELWLPMGTAYKTCNVADQEHDPHSMLNLYKQLIALRKKSKVLRFGEYAPVDSEEGVYAFKRQLGSLALATAVNFTGTPQPIPPELLQGELVLSSADVAQNEPMLAPREGRVVRLAA